MNVFFDSSVSLDKKLFLKVKKVIEKHGLSLNAPNYERNGDWQSMKPPEIRKIYMEAMNKIKNSDVVIFDATIPSMRIGHELAFSLEKGKPTLVLVDASKQTAESIFISGSGSGYLTIRNYKDLEDVAKVVLRFLKGNLDKKKVRLNLAIDKHIMDYIDKKQYESGLSKTAIIKEIIEQQIENE